MTELNYGYVKSLPNTSYGDAIAEVTEALKAEGFGVLMDIDVKATLKQKLDVDFRRYIILGACNPGLALRSLEGEPHIGLLLPCNVVVQEAPEGGVDVSVINPETLFQVVDNPRVAPIAQEVGERLARVLDRLGGAK